MDDSLFDSRIDDINNGRLLWQDIRDRKGIKGNDLVIIYPEDDLVKCAEKYIPIFVEKRCIDRVFALTTDSRLTDRSLYLFIKEISEKDMQNIIAYYSLMPFHTPLVFVSLKYPQGRIKMKSMKNNDISIDDIMKYGFFGFSEEEMPHE